MDSKRVGLCVVLMGLSAGVVACGRVSPTSRTSSGPDFAADMPSGQAGVGASGAAGEPVSCPRPGAIDAGYMNPHADGGSAGVGGQVGPMMAVDGGAPSGFPSVGAAWDEPGTYTVLNEAAGSNHSVYRPTDVKTDGMRHPVILWGNGSLMPTTAYAGLLTYWASHGFVVVAAITLGSGTGVEMLAGIDWLRSSDLAEHVDLARVGASGHSQGGSGAIVAGSDARVAVTVVIQPGSSYVGNRRAVVP